MVISPLMWVISIVTLLVTPLITTMNLQVMVSHIRAVRGHSGWQDILLD